LLPDLTILKAAAPPASQGFVLAGMLIPLPAVLGYTWWSYSVFRGRVAADSARSLNADQTLMGLATPPPPNSPLRTGCSLDSCRRM
jgi:hypothetical protein